MPNKSSVQFKEDLLRAYHKMGGIRALVQWGQANPGDFYRILSKLLPSQMLLNAEVEVTPPPPALTDRELAIRVAFVLAKAQQQQRQQSQSVEAEPAIELLPDPIAPPPVTMATPVAPEETAQTLEHQRDRMLTENTKTCTLNNYAGSPAEHGQSRPRTAEDLPDNMHIVRRRRPLL